MERESTLHPLSVKSGTLKMSYGREREASILKVHPTLQRAHISICVESYTEWILLVYPTWRCEVVWELNGRLQGHFHSLSRKLLT